ncbi:MAG: hypothetical protein ACLTYL_05040 [Faecalibacterium sp.]
MCKSIFHIPARNRAKHFSPYIARSLAVLPEQKEERAFYFRAELPESVKGGFTDEKVLTVTMDGIRYPDYRKARNEMQELVRAQKNVERFFAEEKENTEKTQTR